MARKPAHTVDRDRMVDMLASMIRSERDARNAQTWNVHTSRISAYLDAVAALMGERWSDRLYGDALARV